MDGNAQERDSGAWLRRPVQSWLDRRLRESTAARDALREVEGHCFAIRLEGPDLEIVLAADGERLELVRPGVREPDATLVASPIDALTLARSHSLTELRKTDAQLDGNIHVAEQFARVLELLSPDPEAELAGWIGDMAAHEIAAAGRGFARFIRVSVEALGQDAAEFIQEERPVIARRWEVEEFVEAVDDVRDAVDRAASRLAVLEAGPAAARPR